MRPSPSPVGSDAVSRWGMSGLSETVGHSAGVIEDYLVAENLPYIWCQKCCECASRVKAIITITFGR